MILQVKRLVALWQQERASRKLRRSLHVAVRDVVLAAGCVCLINVKHVHRVLVSLLDLACGLLLLGHPLENLLRAQLRQVSLGPCRSLRHLPILKILMQLHIGLLNICARRPRLLLNPIFTALTAQLVRYNLLHLAQHLI